MSDKTQWQPIETAPEDGTHFVGRVAYRDRRTGKLKYVRRITWWGKVSHVAIHGWCYGRDVENINAWNPTHWQPKFYARGEVAHA